MRHTYIHWVPTEISVNHLVFGVWSGRNEEMEEWCKAQDINWQTTDLPDGVVFEFDSAEVLTAFLLRWA